MKRLWSVYHLGEQFYFWYFSLRNNLKCQKSSGIAGESIKASTRMFFSVLLIIANKQTKEDNLVFNSRRLIKYIMIYPFT